MIYFVGLGVFNGLTTWVEPIIRPRGFTPGDAGLLGALLLVSGILGAVIFPPLSDRWRRRKGFILGGLVLSVPGILGLALAQSLAGLVAAVLSLGFFLIGTSPIGMQYATEVTRPTPEGTSNGLLMLCGQVSVILVYAMEALRGEGGSFTLSLLISAGLLAASALLSSRLVEAPRDLA